MVKRAFNFQIIWTIRRFFGIILHIDICDLKLNRKA